MTKKNIFVYKRFLSLNISDFSLFFMFYTKTATPTLPLTSHSAFAKCRPNADVKCRPNLVTFVNFINYTLINKAP